MSRGRAKSKGRESNILGKGRTWNWEEKQDKAGTVK